MTRLSGPSENKEACEEEEENRANEERLTVLILTQNLNISDRLSAPAHAVLSNTDKVPGLGLGDWVKHQLVPVQHKLVIHSTPVQYSTHLYCGEAASPSLYHMTRPGGLD